MVRKTFKAIFGDTWEFITEGERKGIIFRY